MLSGLIELTINEILRKYYGYEKFRPGQEDIISRIISGQDICAVMPTGAGKSLCYQIPALALPGITLVISPLISLMQDQVRILKAAGISAAYINSSLTPAQIGLALQRAAAGAYKIIYVAPERLESGSFISFARKSDISVIAVDEAHCISLWGHDFRPSYCRIADFTDKLSRRPVVASFTATANRRVRDDIINKLRLKEPYIVTTGYDRPNLYFGVASPVCDGFADPKLEFIKSYIEAHRDENGIIYCNTKKQTEGVAEELRRNGFIAEAYHAGMDSTARRRIQEDFTFGRTPVIAATSAFGMGIDKPDVRFVIHYSMPQRLEEYYQEAGRAGRDGEKAECILLYSYPDYLFLRDYFILRKDSKESNPDMTPQQYQEYTDARLSELYRMKRYASSKNRCLRQQLLDYFGEKSNSCCFNCSCCKNDILLHIAPKKNNEDYDIGLFHSLKAKAAMLSIRTGVPVFAIADDRILKELASQKPVTEAELRRIPGFTPVKLRHYGQDFIRTIKEYCKENIPKV